MREQSVAETSIPIVSKKPLIPKPPEHSQFPAIATAEEKTPKQIDPDKVPQELANFPNQGTNKIAEVSDANPTLNKTDKFSKERFDKLYKLARHLVYEHSIVRATLHHVLRKDLSYTTKLTEAFYSELQMLKEALRTQDYFLPTLDIVRYLILASNNYLVDKENKFRDFATYFIEQNIGYLKTVIDTDPDNHRKLKAFTAATNWLCEGNEPQQKLAVDFLVNNYETMLKSAPVENRIDVYEDLRIIRHKAGTKEKEKINQLLVKMSTDPDPSIREFVAEVKITRRKPLMPAAPGVKEFLEKHGLDTNSFIYAWSKSGNDNDLTKIFARNIKTISRIETERPGITKVLSDEFDIRDFARYPEEMLIAQYDQRKDKIPYGIILYPKGDYNGTFYDNRRIFKSLRKQLDSLGYGVRIFEVGNKYEIARTLIRLNQLYGQNHKISFAIIGGHGSWKSIAFGTGGSLNKDNLHSQGAQRTIEFFESSPTIILNSCDTGVKKGIAQKISKLYGRIIAPDQSTPLSSIKVKLGNDRQLRFKVKYYQLNRPHLPRRAGRKFPE